MKWHSLHNVSLAPDMSRWRFGRVVKARPCYAYVNSFSSLIGRGSCPREFESEVENLTGVVPLSRFSFF